MSCLKHIASFTWLLLCTAVHAQDTELKAGPELLNADSLGEAFQPFLTQLQQAIQDGDVVGAQFAIGTQQQPLQVQNFGVVAPGSPDPVDDHSQFCVGSCSKPLVSALAMCLVADERLELDRSIENYLPEFSALKLKTGGAARVPSLRELLCHRGGIYSQRNPLTPEQKNYIRDFRLTLGQAVQGIATEPLDAQPGSVYAYSGAGYCVAGRIIESVAEESLDAVLQQFLCRPLRLTRTTYFPSQSNSSHQIAIGFEGEALNMAPHLLAKQHRLALAGGSIYSTASEMGRFASLILGKGEFEGTTVMPIEQWHETTRPQFEGQTYGLGWSLVSDSQEASKIVGLRHAGALSSYRSFVTIDLEHGYYAVANMTVSRADYSVRPLQAAIHEGLGQLSK